MTAEALDPWEALVSSPRARTARYAFPGGVSRTVVVEDPDCAAVFSPGAPLVEEAKRLADKAVVLVAPSLGHISGIESWCAALPHANLVALAPTASRLRAAGVSVQVLDPARARLPKGVQLRVPPGSGLGEIWMRVEEPARVQWIVCDALTNLESLSPSRWLRVLQWLYGLRPGLVTSPALRRSVTDLTAFRGWVHDEFQQGCDTLTPCHGESHQGPDLADRIMRALDRLTARR